jgi:hypothetical protein
MSAVTGITVNRQAGGGFFRATLHLNWHFINETSTDCLIMERLSTRHWTGDYGGS